MKKITKIQKKRIARSLKGDIITYMPIGTLLDNKITMKENTKRYIVSSLISFASGFAMVLVSQIDNITLGSLKDGSIVGVVFLALRTGIKAVAELFLLTFKK